MPSNRFFVGNLHAPGETIRIDGADAHKIRNVLRLKSGDTIAVCDSAGAEFEGVIVASDNGIEVLLAKMISTKMGPHVRITVAQGIPKGQKMDFVVEKLTELGVESIVPLHSERTIGHANDTKTERWRRLARTAAQQSGRRSIPEITESVLLGQFLMRVSEYDLVLIPWELAEQRPPTETLPQLTADARTIAIIVGPEGGFSHAEADAAREAGAHPVWLGPRILRTETAALALVAILNYLKNS